MISAGAIGTVAKQRRRGGRPAVHPATVFGLDLTATLPKASELNGLHAKSAPVVYAADFTGFDPASSGLIWKSGASGVGASLSVQNGQLILRAGNGAAQWPAGCAYVTVPAPVGDGTLVWEIGAGTVRLFWNGAQLGLQMGSFIGDYAGSAGSLYLGDDSNVPVGAPVTAFAGYDTASDLQYFEAQLVPRPVVYPTTDFVATIQTTAPNETVTLPLWPSGSYNGIVDMGDGTGAFAVTSATEPRLTARYATPGLHTIRARGTISAILFANSPAAPKLRRIDCLGVLGWTRAISAFSGCSGLVSVVAGQTDFGNARHFYGSFKSCTSLQTCDLSTVDFTGTTHYEQMFAFDAALQTFDFTGVDTSNAIRMDEMFLQCSSLTGIDISGFDLSALSATGGMFNFMTGTPPLAQSVYDAFLISINQQDLSPGIFFGFNTSPLTLGGAAQAARTALINKGMYFDDILTGPPAAMAAPQLAVSATALTVTRASAPFNNGLPVTSYNLRYSSDLTNWTTITGIADTQQITGLAAATLIHVQTQAVNYRGGGAWSATASITTPGTGTGTGGGSFAVEGIDNQPVILATSGNLTVTIGTGPYAGTYATDYQGNPLTVAAVEAAPVALTRPVPEGTMAAGEMLLTRPALMIYTGADRGDFSFVHRLNGVPVPNEAAADHLIALGDNGKSYVVQQQYGGVTVSSLPVTIAFELSGVVPERMLAPILEVESNTRITATLAAPPDDNGLPITSYDLRYATIDGDWVQLTDVTSPQAIAGLQSTTTYQVQSRAVNEAGPGSWSLSEVATTTNTTSTAMQDDPGAVLWYHPADVTVNAANTITSWPNHIAGSSALYDLAPGPINAPVWDAANGKAVFTNGGGRTLRSTVNFVNPATTLVRDQGATLVLMAVVQTKADASRAIFLALCQSEIDTQSMGFGVGNASGGTTSDLGMYRLAKGTNVAFGTDFGVRATAGLTPPGKCLMEWHVSPTQVQGYVNGVLEFTEAVTAAHLPFATNTRVVLGARASATALQRDFGFDLFEIFMTTNVANVAVFRNELTERHAL